jgi:hypothetical protein
MKLEPEELVKLEDKVIYLASPYTHEVEDVRVERYNQVTVAAAKIMQQGHMVFSPISHSHPIGDHLAEGLSMNWDFWRKQDFCWLRKCEEVWVLTLDGWVESVGVTAEIDEAKRLGLPVRLLCPDTMVCKPL